MWKKTQIEKKNKEKNKKKQKQKTRQNDLKYVTTAQYYTQHGKGSVIIFVDSILLATVVAALAMKNLVLTRTTKSRTIVEMIKHSKVEIKGNGTFLGDHFHRRSTNLNKKL